MGKEVKPSLFADDMILYTRKITKIVPDNKICLKTIDKFRNVSGYKTNLQKSLAFYTPPTNI